MRIQNFIPNFLTSCNLICGFIAIVLALDLNTLPIAPWFIFIAALFDFSDGFAARIFKAYSELGKQLDSLADMVSFGVAPGIILYKLLQLSFFTYSMPLGYHLLVIVMAAFVPVFSALRLAKFNIDERQTTSFVGLPTPASAILIASVCLVFLTSDNLMLQYLIANKYSLLALIVVDSFLMISELPMFSLKMKGLTWKGHESQYIFLVSSVILFALLKLTALPFIIILYILISVFAYFYNKIRATV